MPRPKLNRKREFIQLSLEAEDKAAFEAWCADNRVTMSDIIRKEIAPYVAKGKKLQEAPGTVA